MAKKYWVTLVEENVVDVSVKPDDRLAAINDRIEGTDICIDDNILLFVEYGVVCKLGTHTKIVESDRDDALGMISTGMTFLKIKIENLKRIKSRMGAQE